MELSKDARAKKEFKKLKKIFADLTKNELTIYEPLMQNAAFMKITLEDLQREINENGCTESYQNGKNQEGVKISATAQQYNSMVKNYDNVIKHLETRLPADKTGGSKLAELMKL